MALDYKKQTAWKIVYTDFSDMERRAVELLNREAGKNIIRNTGVYTLYVLPLEKESADTKIKDNAFVVGVWDKSPLIQSLVSKNEIPPKGYFLRVMDNPANENGSIVVITGNEQADLFYGAEAFLDAYAVKFAPNGGGLFFTDNLFDMKLPIATYASAPKFATRGIFSWGHCINDYRTYLRTMARLGLNQLILWNDFTPLNAKDVVEYAHSYGIEVIWGFSWGWTSGGCKSTTSLDNEYLSNLKEQVLQKFEREYLGQGDGIYFQSFTERKDDSIGGRSIADAVTDFVNDTAGELLKRYPTLRIQFGLHATSVKNHLSAIAKVDKRVEILWEDGGEFPFNFGNARIHDYETFNKEFEETLAFTKEILLLRGLDAPTGIVYKGFMKLDWTRFAHQTGPFILGENAEEIQNHDRQIRDDAWRGLTADWLKNGAYAHRFTSLIYELTKGNVNMCMAGTFDGGTYFPQAVCAEMFWDPEREYPEIMKSAMDKNFVIIN